MSNRDSRPDDIPPPKGFPLPAFSDRPVHHRLSDHVILAEVVCKHCGRIAQTWKESGTSCDPDLLALYEKLREKLGGHPLHIVSAYRCPKHNSATSGRAKLSQHMAGKAFDLVSKVFRPRQVGVAADEINPRGGVGIYPGFVHIDTRGRKARW